MKESGCRKNPRRIHEGGGHLLRIDKGLRVVSTIPFQYLLFVTRYSWYGIIRYTKIDYELAIHNQQVSMSMSNSSIYRGDILNKYHWHGVRLNSMRLTGIA